MGLGLGSWFGLKLYRTEILAGMIGLGEGLGFAEVIWLGSREGLVFTERFRVRIKVRVRARGRVGVRSKKRDGFRVIMIVRIRGVRRRIRVRVRRRSGVGIRAGRRGRIVVGEGVGSRSKMEHSGGKTCAVVGWLEREGVREASVLFLMLGVKPLEYCLMGRLRESGVVALRKSVKLEQIRLNQLVFDCGFESMFWVITRFMEKGEGVCGFEVNFCLSHFVCCLSTVERLALVLGLMLGLDARFRVSLRLWFRVRLWLN